MNTLPPELIVLVAQFYISSWTHFPGEWTLTGQPISPTHFPRVAPEFNVQARNRAQISASPLGDASPITLCHINSTFRAIVQNEPSLWSFLSIRNPRRVDLVYLWLKYLGQAPLCLDLYLNYTSGDARDDFAYDENHPAYQTARALLQIAPQWRAARMTIHQTCNLTTLLLQVPAASLGAVDPSSDSPDIPDPHSSKTEPALDPSCARASAAFCQLESLALVYAPRQGIPDYIGSFIPQEHFLGIEQYQPFIYAPRLKYMHWAMAYFPEWAEPTLHPPIPWQGVTELVLTRAISGVATWRLLRSMKSLKKFGLLGGLRSPIRPGPDYEDYSPHFSSTDNPIAVSGVEELVFAMGLPSLRVFVQWVKFPRLRRLRIDLGNTSAGTKPRPFNFDRSTIVDPILDGRSTSEVRVEAILDGVVLSM